MYEVAPKEHFRAQKAKGEQAMKIIDTARKGNVVRFYLGEKTDDWGWTNKDYKDSDGKTPIWLKPSDGYYGDDWNDTPYEHNAGSVYDEFVKGFKDVAFPFDSIVMEPSDGELNSPYCMDDFVARKSPKLLVISKEAQDRLYDDGAGHSTWYYDYSYKNAMSVIREWEAQHHEKLPGVSYYYLGDDMVAEGV